MKDRCPVCYYDITRTSSVAFETWDKSYSHSISIHSECLLRWIEAELKRGRLPQFGPLSQRDLYEFTKEDLPTGLVARYDELLVIAGTGRKDLLRHCGCCNVLYVSCARSKEDLRAKCPNCGECPFGLDTVADRQFRRWRNGHSHQQCRDCGRIVQKSSGCVHMVCRCGSDFCYGCGARAGESHSITCGTRHAVCRCVYEISSFAWRVKRYLSSVAHL